MRRGALLAGAAAALGLLAAAPADASVVFERDAEIWIAGDDGSGERRLAAGWEPHIAPGGHTVVYRSPGTGRRVYTVPAAGGPRRLLVTLPTIRELGTRYADVRLSLDFAADGRHMLLSPQFGDRTLLADLATGAVRRLRVPTFSSVISPDGKQVAWAGRRRRCDLDVLDLASGRVRSLVRGLCLSDAEWGPRGIGVITETRRSATLSEIDPVSGRVRRRFSARRPFSLHEPGAAGTWHLEAYQSGRHRFAAWLILPDGRRRSLVMPRGSSNPPAFTPDDRAVIVITDIATLTRIDVATGARTAIGGSDGAFDVG